MKFNSPLRYPGGKKALSNTLVQIRELNEYNDFALAEPFAGGAGASLELLYREEVDEIYINDADPCIYDFWWSLINNSKQFLTRMMTAPINLNEWEKQRIVYKKKRPSSRLARGFSAFYLNRTNRSGIIVNGGPIGGYEQKGKWKLDARFNKVTLKKRCEKIIEYKERISVSGMDAIDFIQSLGDKKIFFFIDPPYFKKGPLLYLNLLDQDYHQRLADTLRGMQQNAWVLTYDDCPEIRDMYRDWATIKPFSLRYSASTSKKGNEIMITPRHVTLPLSQKSGSIEW